MGKEILMTAVAVTIGVIVAAFVLQKVLKMGSPVASWEESYEETE